MYVDPCHAEFILRDIRYIFIFSLIFTLNLMHLVEMLTYGRQASLSCKINTVAAVVLVMQGHGINQVKLEYIPVAKGLMTRPAASLWVASSLVVLAYNTSWVDPEAMYFIQVLFCYFNSLWPRDIIWHHWTWSTLAPVMACCLTASSHYLN